MIAALYVIPDAPQSVSLLSQSLAFGRSYGNSTDPIPAGDVSDYNRLMVGTLYPVTKHCSGKSRLSSKIGI